MLRFYALVSEKLGGAKADAARLAQRGLAKQLCCSQSAVGAYARGQSLPPVSRLPQFAEALGLPIERLAAIVATDRAAKRTALMREAAAYHQRRRSPAAGAA